MKTVTGEYKNGVICVALHGRITSDNAAEAEKEMRALCEEHAGDPVAADASALDYISSAGLRVLLHLLKNHPDVTVREVSPELYEIFDMTGFTEMMKVEKAYREVSVEGCEEIGRGANGTIYRIDQDNVVKVYNNADALSEIQHEREMARLALVSGIPTAISYDVVRVGDSYGSVFELLKARSFSEILTDEPEKLEWCAQEYVKILKMIHETEVLPGKLPDMRETALDWAAFMKDHLPEEAGEKLYALIEAVPQDDHMLHGDYHTKNLELMGDEVLLIDMDTLAAGHPVFELASMYNAFLGFSELDHGIVKRFQGFDWEISQRFWKRTLSLYLDTEDPARIEEVENKARIVGYTRLIRRAIRRTDGWETPPPEIAHWTNELLSLLEKTDTLLF